MYRYFILDFVNIFFKKKRYIKQKYNCFLLLGPQKENVIVIAWKGYMKKHYIKSPKYKDV